MTTVLPRNGEEATVRPGTGSLSAPPDADPGAAALGRVALDAGRLVTALLSPAGTATRPTTAAPVGPPEVRVGVDLVMVAEVARSVETLGDRYVHRIFTPHEVACCQVPAAVGPGPAPTVGPAYTYLLDSLAARFAAKEAALKVLRPDGPRPEWRAIEVHRDAGGWCELRLTGAAALLAERAGLGPLAVSMTHEGGVAAAVVVAVAMAPQGQHRTGPIAPGDTPDRQGER